MTYTYEPHELARVNRKLASTPAPTWLYAEDLLRNTSANDAVFFSEDEPTVDNPEHLYRVDDLADNALWASSVMAEGDFGSALGFISSYACCLMEAADTASESDLNGLALMEDEGDGYMLQLVNNGDLTA